MQIARKASRSGRPAAWARGTRGQRRPLVPSLSSVLVAIDASDGSDGAARPLARAALLPIVPGGRVLALHVRPQGEAMSDRAGAMDPDERLREIVGRIAAEARAPGLRFEAITLRGDPVQGILLQARAAAADVVVLGRAPGISGDHPFGGALSEHLLRHLEIPALVVTRPPHGPYARPLAAVELDEGATRVIREAHRLAGGAPRRLGVLHAYRVPGAPWLASAEGVSPDVIEGLATAAEAELRARVDGLLRATLPPATAATQLLRRGDPRLAIERAVTELQADLLAVGKRARSRLGRLLRGNTAEWAARNASCDVLVVPTPPPV
jgi:nucleotide-binding universal stress UspA family protein